MSHTPGPWIDGHNVSHEPTVRSSQPDADNGGFIVATCHGPNARDNARLIAAAPELLQALEELLFASRGLVEEKYLRDARAVLAKATGGAE